MKYRLLFALLITLVATSLALPFAVAQETTATPVAVADTCVTNYDASVDYFPDKITLEYATGFSVEYHNNYKVVTIAQPWQGAEDAANYVLVECGTPAPKDVKADAVIEVPVKSIVTMSTTFLPHIVGQGLLDKLVGVDSINYTNTPEVVAKYEAGNLAAVSPNFGEINTELLIDLQPGLIMAQRFDDTDKVYPALQAAGLPVVLNADFLDTTPLGQAEWGKYISLFFNTEAVAQKAFDGVATRYTDLVKLAATADAEPTVFANTPYQGSWFMPGGKSYLARFFADAGAAYIWADDTSTGSIPLDFETVFDKASAADFWVNAGFFWSTKADALAEDDRFKEFAAFKSDHVFTNNGHVNANGGSDYFETGVTNPDLILADLVKIFHPDLLPEYELYFYRQLAK